MNKIEKAIFLHLRQYQYTTDENSEITSTYSNMSADEKKEYGNLSRELHTIYNHINSKPVLNVKADDGVNSIQTYHEKYGPVSDTILKIVNDFGFTLRDSVTKKQKEAIIAILGEEYYQSNYGDKPVIEDLD